MWTHRAALPVALLLAACQAYGRPDVALRRDFAGVEINRIGDHHPFYSDYEDIALLDALIPTALDIDPFHGRKWARRAPRRKRGAAQRAPDWRQKSPR